MPKQEFKEHAFTAPDQADGEYGDELPTAAQTKRPGAPPPEEVVDHGGKDASKTSKGSKKSKGSKTTPDGIRSTGSPKSSGIPHAGVNGPQKANMHVETPNGPSGSKNADMGLLIQEIKDKRDGLCHDNECDNRDLIMIQEQLERLQDQWDIVDDRITHRNLALEQYDKTLKMTKVAFDRLMETAQSLQDALEG